SDLLSGANGEGGRLSFERHVMGSVFREIVDQANYRLLNMSGGRFELVHRYEASAKNKKAGLELSIQCNSGAPPRDTRTVSGGEAFMVSLALALGLSDVVKNHSGGISMESMFIDEGFGSLDGDKLDRAISVLNKLTGEDGDARQIGIISHVEKLGECIPKQILVKNTENGSTVRIIG
ncbi:MAG: SMC family ATPase, partial [Oscillospiraceae bacterium]|nr:SMC family ATPase [Oscillospiraceae bacterium]